jgi:small-conductance mechanosensitive channel
LQSCVIMTVMLQSYFQEMQDTWFTFLGNYSDDLVRFALYFIASFVVLFIIKRVVLTQLHRVAKKTSTNLDEFMLDVMSVWNWFVLILFSTYFALKTVELPSQYESLVSLVMNIAIGWYVVQTVLALLKFGFNRYVAQRQRYEEDFDPTIIMFMRQVASILIWLIAALVVMQNLGYEVTALVGGLGLGGLAVAFAVQNLLSDVFSSVSIYFDKPFKIGDFIVVGEDSGVVKKIGIKSTRLQTLQGEELVISNKELTESRVNNFKKMLTRRVAFNIGVEYDTPTSKLKQIPEILKEIIEKQENVSFDRSHFKTLGDFSLIFETVYIVNSSEFLTYMNIQQAINIEILDTFNKKKIEIAFPTQKMLNANV